MRRFIVAPSEIQNSEVLLSPKESRHALSALRLKVGAQVHLMDGQGRQARGIIGAIEDGRVRVMACESPAGKNSPKVRVTLAVSVIKPDRMEWLIEKACELGVAAIVPVLTERCVVKISKERWKSKVERWRKIAVESCKQCGLVDFPRIDEVVRLKEFLDRIKDYDQVLIPTLAVRGEELSAHLNLKFEKTSGILAFIGPEGDFTKKEVEMVVTRGGKPVSLGKLTLRSETASVYFLSVVSFFYHEIARS